MPDLLKVKIIAMYLIIDLEATCWENRRNRENMETIEIGAVLVNKNYKIIAEYQTFIKPIKNPILSEFCQNLTTIRQQDIDQAEFFPVAFSKFINWVEKITKDDIKNIVPCSWGHYDKKQLLKDCQFHNIKFPFLRYYSIKHKFAEIKKIKPMGMKKALEICQIKLNGTRHRAIDDAKNITKIFIKEKVI